MKLTLTTVHPAPYFDRLFEYFNTKGITTEAWYLTKSTKEKEWKTYLPIDVHLYSEASTSEMYRRFSKSDFVIFHWGNKRNFVIAFLLRLRGKKFAFYLDHPDPLSSKTKGIAKVGKKLLMNLATYMFPACYSCGNYLMETYGLNKNKIRVFPYSHSECPNGIEKINCERERSLKSNESPIKILIASRFIERKGYSIVCDAFQLLANKNILKEFEIHVVGSGELYNEYKTRLLDIDQSIRFYGWLENNEYEKMLNETDVYLHPSLFEPFGIPPLDAMERGKFIIVSDAVKSTDIFEDCEGIKLYPANDAQSLARCLENVAMTKEQLYQKTKGNINLCQRFYSMEVNLKALTD